MSCRIDSIARIITCVTESIQILCIRWTRYKRVGRYESFQFWQVEASLVIHHAAGGAVKALAGVAEISQGAQLPGVLLPPV